MPKKKFEQGEDALYDPFAAEEKRAAIRAAVSPKSEESRGGREPVVTLAPRTAEQAAQDSGAVTKSQRTQSPSKTAPKADLPPPAPAVPRLEKTGSPDAGALARAIQRQTVQKRFRVTEDEEGEFDAFVLRLKQASTSKVDFSVVSRVLWTIVQHAEPQILDELKRVNVPRRPGKHDTLALAEYEELWARLISQALRKMPPIK